MQKLFHSAMSPALRLALAAGVAAAALALGSELAHAASTGTGLPWETPLQKITDSIRGPVAYVFSLLGLIVAGAALVFGGEINEFVRRIIMLVLVISLILFASNILMTLFNSGAVVQ